MERRKPHARDLRKGRFSQAGRSYFLTTAVAGRRQIFAEQRRAIIVLDAVRWLQSRKRFCVDAVVVMPDHLHVVGQLGDGSRLQGAFAGSTEIASRPEAAPTLATVMHTLKSFTASRLGMTGVQSSVWQPGYHDHGLRDDEDYRRRVRYVIQNPLRAGLARRVEDYLYVILPDWWSED